MILLFFRGRERYKAEATAAYFRDSRPVESLFPSFLQRVLITVLPEKALLKSAPVEVIQVATKGRDQ
jgi:hypothetical protein